MFATGNPQPGATTGIRPATKTQVSAAPTDQHALLVVMEPGLNRGFHS